MAEFNNMRSHLSQTEPSVLTKAVLKPHVRFKLEDTNEPAVDSPQYDINDTWMAQANDPEKMQALGIEWGARGGKTNNRRPLCTELMKNMLSM